MSPSLPLHGKTALITGVSRRRGIGFAVATKLASLGADVVIHHHRPHDLDLPWGGDDLDKVRAGVRASLTEGARFADIAGDLADPDPARGHRAHRRAETTDRSLEDLDRCAASTPFGRVGRPEDPAELIGWLSTAAGSWVVGQVLTSDGGFAL